jgi:hypothetical protein
MLSKQSEKIKEARQQKYLDDCRKRLSTIAEKKMQTVFIGALDAIEHAFGHLWGIDLRDEDRTDEEKEIFELWQELRTEILNNGNNQARALLNEISNHVVQWNRYGATFTIVNKDK